MHIIAVHVRPSLKQAAAVQWPPVHRIYEAPDLFDDARPQHVGLIEIPIDSLPARRTQRDVATVPGVARLLAQIFVIRAEDVQFSHTGRLLWGELELVRS